MNNHVTSWHSFWWVWWPGCNLYLTIPCYHLKVYKLNFGEGVGTNPFHLSVHGLTWPEEHKLADSYGPMVISTYIPVGCAVCNLIISGGSCSAAILECLKIIILLNHASSNWWWSHGTGVVLYKSLVLSSDQPTEWTMLNRCFNLRLFSLLSCWFCSLQD